jgi:hypothetical protein
MAPYAGTTRLTMSRDAVEGSPGAAFLRSVQQAVGADYEVLGELGRRGRTIVYLAREAQTTQLVALRLQPAPGASESSGDFTLDVVRQLDGSMPASKVACPRCSRDLESWGRYCSRCGADLAGIIPQTGDEMLAAVKEASRGKYDIVGKLPRAEGGGVVYFALELATKKLVALRLQKEAGAAGAFVLDRTQVIKSVAEELGVAHGATGFPKAEVPRNQPTPPPERPPVPIGIPTPPPEPPPVIQRRPFTWNAQTITLAATAAVALVFLAFLIGRVSHGGGSSNATPVVTKPTAPSPPAKDTSPKVVQSADTVARIDSASVRVAGTVPAGARFTVDGQVVADSQVRVAPGAHRLRLAASGFIPAEQQVNLEPGEKMVWSPQIARAPAPTPKPKATPSVATPARAPDPPPPPTCVSLSERKEFARALTTCQAEADAGNASSQLVLAMLYDPVGGFSPDANLALKWYTQAADGGSGAAAHRLGLLRRDGAPGISRDDGASFHWFQRGAELGDHDAELELAEAYFRGKGVRGNKTEAAMWYRTAAEHNVPEAQYKLGLLFAKGDAVAKNDQTAVQWFRRAAAQGHAGARDELARRGITP